MLHSERMLRTMQLGFCLVASSLIAAPASAARWSALGPVSFLGTFDPEGTIPYSAFGESVAGLDVPAKLLRMGKSNEAFDVVRSWLMKHQDSVAGHHLLACAAIQDNRRAEAIRVFLKLDTGNTRVNLAAAVAINTVLYPSDSPKMHRWVVANFAKKDQGKIWRLRSMLGQYRGQNGAAALVFALLQSTVPGRRAQLLEASSYDRHGYMGLIQAANFLEGPLRQYDARTGREEKIDDDERPQYDRARSLIEKHVQKHGPSSYATLLMGMVTSYGGDMDAGLRLVKESLRTGLSNPFTANYARIVVAKLPVRETWLRIEQNIKDEEMLLGWK